ncbi:MAG: DUF255 domain-containing protein [Bacteroidetes bacterium]|jgi:uncharacterized protein YyaL (SSP411 family)|nr:DUF255 domain-containing protein [Bacteroidota bacterium]
MNRLVDEKSPYLLQHADNPVDWYPWSEEAFEKARREDKPVFLSIGYATCHWCHVMAHESFEDDDVAQLMNETFINIKLDREERPDIDNTYMTVCQMITGHGGWPLTIIMTPDKEPFYAATYIPKHSRSNRMGMMEFIPAIADAWKNDRENVMKSAEQIKHGFSRTLNLGRADSEVPVEMIHKARQELKNRYDPVKGGFGTAPKFPSPHNLLFLLEYHRLNEDKKALSMVHHTLQEMRLGGIWDHVGFGFHRYSTDQEWLLPHFEKMLYDQANLLRAYAEAWRDTRDPLFKETVYQILEYLDECMTSAEGAFFSAEDADSEGEEGTFYIWSESEIDGILSREDAELFKRLFNFEPQGNFRDEATGQKTGRNIPHLSKKPESLAEELEMDRDDLTSRIAQMLSEVKQVREKRERPLLDDKILTDWNGLMISALCRAGIIFKDDTLIDRAEKAWSVLEKTCLTEEGKLLHRLKDGEAEIGGMADDFAFTILALTDLYDATFNPHYLKTAVGLQERFDADFLDDTYGGYFFTSEDAEELLGRQKEIYDGAIPSSNSVASHNLIKLSRRTGNPGFEEKANQIFRTFSDQIDHSPSSYTYAMLALSAMHSPATELLISSKDKNDRVVSAVQQARELLNGNSSILLKLDNTSSRLAEVAPFTKEYPVEQRLSIFVCKNFQCERPVHTIREMRDLLKER